MKLLTGKRIGQSAQELVPAVFFSFLLHIIFLFAAVFLYMRTTPKVYIPLAYQVKLVGPVADIPRILPESPPAPAVPEKKPKAGKAQPKKGGMPELRKQKPEKDYVAEDEAGPEKPVVKQGSVSVAAPQDFKFIPYLAIVHDKVERHWNPPPGAREAKARVQFTILRSGRVGDARLEESSGSFYFDQAAMRAILSSSPFPPLPEEFFKEYEVFSVDLMEKE